MRPVFRSSSSLSRIRWALRNQERNSSTFSSKSRKLLVGVHQNEALVNANTCNSTLFSRLSFSRGLSAEAVEAADAAIKLTVSSSGLFLSNQTRPISEVFVLLEFSMMVDIVICKTADVNRTGPLVEYERRISDGELMTGDICQVR